MKKSAGFFAASLIFLLACLCLPAETALGDSVLTSRSFMIKGEEQEGPLYDYILLADQSVRIVKC
ncbi:MAG: hypothetical protein K5663_06010, partial [Clostridiales bacterium]|nr:hypothetical protein [Clostridiales bacterium]